MIKIYKKTGLLIFARNSTVIFSIMFYLGAPGYSITAAADGLNSSYQMEAAYNYTGAFEILDRLAVQNPRSYFLQLRAGWLAYMSGQYSRSIEFYQKAAALEPESIESRTGILLPLMALGKYKQAEVVALAVLKTDQNNYLAKSRLAYSLYMNGEYRQSEKYYSEIVILYPSDTSMLIGLGWSQLKQGKKKNATETFMRAHEILPGNKQVEEGLLLSRPENP